MKETESCLLCLFQRPAAIFRSRAFCFSKSIPQNLSKKQLS